MKDRIAEAARKRKVGYGLKEGVEMTLKQLSAAFDKNRLLEIAPEAGERLDPMKHQAISMVPAEQ